MKEYAALFIDLDGTLIETQSGKTFAEGIWDMKLKFDVLKAIKNLKSSYIFIVTNQGGIGKFVAETAFNAKLDFVTACVAEYCKDSDTPFLIDAMFCPSMEKSDSFRKPNDGMFKHFYHSYELANEGILKSDCLMVGDASGKLGDFSDSDKCFADNAGIDYLDVNDFVAQYGTKE